MHVYEYSNSSNSTDITVLVKADLGYCITCSENERRYSKGDEKVQVLNEY